MKIEEELAEFLIKNSPYIYDSSLRLRIDSIDILLNHQLSHLFKPLVIIINPTNGYTPAFQDQFVDNLYNLAGALAGSICIYTAQELKELVIRGFLTPDELVFIDQSKSSLDYFCHNQNGTIFR